MKAFPPSDPGGREVRGPWTGMAIFAGVPQRPVSAPGVSGGGRG